MEIRWKSGTITKNITEYVEKVTWEGSDTQASRTATITVAFDYYKKVYLNIKPGDLLFLYEKKGIFAGVIVDRTRTGEIGTVSHTARDFLHYLLRSSGSYNFKNTTPEKIAKKVCDDLMIQTGKLYATKIHLKSLLCEQDSYYKIIVSAYNNAARKMSDKYPPAFMPAMDMQKLSVIIKGQLSGRTLDSDRDIISSEYKETTDDMVTVVKILNDKGKLIGKVESTKNVNKYGVYQSVYEKKEKENAKTAAKQLLAGLTKEAKIRAVGYVECMAGYSVNIKDPASGLKGKFYIENDVHTWENGTHTMELNLRFSNELEEV